MASSALHDDVLDALGRRIVARELATGTVITLGAVDSKYARAAMQAIIEEATEATAGADD
jgi:hypothetical protein